MQWSTSSERAQGSGESALVALGRAARPLLTGGKEHISTELHRSIRW